jgi:uroporphyrinogen decarboxylase
LLANPLRFSYRGGVITAKERIACILARRPTDRIGLFEHFWSDTQKAWAAQGHIREDENLSDHFGYDLELCWPLNMVADLDFVPQVIEETAETKLVRDGNGALLRQHKLHDATPEHVDFLVKDRAGWEEHIKPILRPDPRRIDFAAYRRARAHAAEKGLFFCWSGVNVFEIMKDVTGHEYMLMGMALDPDWVRDMVDTYARLVLQLQEMLFAQEGWPDGIWYYEDMGFKQRPFMSPTMYREILQPGHTLTFSLARAHKLPVIVHSCGFVEPLVPGLLESGMNCLQVIEIKAGMDLLKLHRTFRDRLSFMGGIDVRALYTNDRAIIEKELVGKVPEVKQGFGYVLHSDHSIPNTVTYETYRWFLDRGRELGRY